MRNVLILLFLACSFVSAVAKNLVINPGFDETPWDTGWTWGGGSDEGISIAIPDSNRYYTSPPSCKLQARTSWHYAHIYLFQEIRPSTSCTCIVYFQNISNNSIYASTEYYIYVKVNNVYLTEWACEGDNPFWTRWGKIYSCSDTLSSINFSATAISGLHGATGDANFWIDDVYISGTEVGIEEGISNRNESLEIYPNPFTSQTIMYYSIDKEKFGCNNNLRIKIYDLSGRLIHELNNLGNQEFNQVVWDGKDKQGNTVISGVYFVRLEIISGLISFPAKKIIKF